MALLREGSYRAAPLVAGARAGDEQQALQRVEGLRVVMTSEKAVPALEEAGVRAIKVRHAPPCMQAVMLHAAGMAGSRHALPCVPHACFTASYVLPVPWHAW